MRNVTIFDGTGYEVLLEPSAWPRSSQKFETATGLVNIWVTIGILWYIMVYHGISMYIIHHYT